MILIATWQGWPERDLTPLVDEAVAREPEFWQTYFAAAEYYSPLWNGNAERLEGFASWAADRAGGASGDALYTRIYWWSSDRYFKGQFSDSKINCGRMMHGVDRLMQTNPDSWNLNHFAKFAVLCDERAKARELFSKIADSPILEAWGRSEQMFMHYKKWARE